MLLFLVLAGNFVLFRFLRSYMLFSSRPFLCALASDMVFKFVYLLPPLSLSPLSLPLQSLLQTYDRDILQELWKIRTGIHEIREGHKQALTEENKDQDDTSSERSLSPSSLKQPGEDQHSLSPSPNSGTGMCNVLSTMICQ